MKKLTLVAAAGLMVLFASCKRDWVCQCSYSGITVDAETYLDSSKKDAESNCDKVQADAQDANSGISCEIEKK